jgi:hypothetical protein
MRAEAICRPRPLDRRDRKANSERAAVNVGEAAAPAGVAADPAGAAVANAVTIDY